jgi:ammonia channel protein AmtB
VVGEAEIMMTTEALLNTVEAVGVVVMVAVLMEKVETPFMVQGAVEEEVAVTPLAQMVEAGGHTPLGASPLVVVLLVVLIMAPLERVETLAVATVVVGLEVTKLVTQAQAERVECQVAAAAVEAQATMPIMVVVVREPEAK